MIERRLGLKKEYSGLLMFRIRERRIRVLLFHPGGPQWKDKDLGAWTIPHTELNSDDDTITAGCRALHEQTTIVASRPFYPLGDVVENSRKILGAWAFEGDFGANKLRSDKTTIEWPPHSGKRIQHVRFDQYGFFPIFLAKKLIQPNLIPLLEGLEVFCHDEWLLNDSKPAVFGGASHSSIATK